jgi:phospholipid-binding lipoprotein MlaA
VLVLAVVLLTAGCATPPPKSDREAYEEFRKTNDPLEPTNRVIFGFNQGIDAMFLKPLSEFYRLLLPPIFQTGVHNFVANMREPVTFVNDALQWEWNRAGSTAARFGINSTLGVGGLGNPATRFGFERHKEDFGQTLAVWGLPDGPYLVIPLLGPSSPRDFTGFMVDNFIFDPFGGIIPTSNSTELNRLQYVRIGLTAIDARSQNFEEINDLQKSSLDFYAAVRSLYRQMRQAEINQGRPVDQPEGPILEDFPSVPLE